MQDAQTELLKQMLVSFIRKALFTIGAFLVTRGWIDQNIANSLLGDSFIWWVAGLVIVAGSILWQYMKIKFNNAVNKAAIKAPEGTPLSEVKAEVLENKSLVSSL